MKRRPPQKTAAPAKSLSDRIGLALQVAFDLHRDQYRKGSAIPYLSHLMGVASVALRFGASEDEAIAALLHDAIEDRGGAAARELLRQLLGAKVTAIVDECTDTDITPKPPWRTRKEAYLASLPDHSAAALRIAAADKLDNVRALIAGYRACGETLWAQFRGGRDGTLWYHRSVLAILQKTLPGPLVDQLARAVAELEQLAAGQ